ncbi:hypothetical protein ACLOJK_016718 [Asimina triloba]
MILSPQTTEENGRPFLLSLTHQQRELFARPIPHPAVQLGVKLEGALRISQGFPSPGATIFPSFFTMVIDFTATWCGPCRSMEPVMIDLANRFSEVAFVKIDVDELKEVAAEWGVEAMPTFVMVKKGKEVDRIVGARKDELLKKIEKHMLIEEDFVPFKGEYGTVEKFDTSS